MTRSTLSHLRPSLLVAMALLLGLALAPTRAWAASFEVSPVALPLAAGASSGILTITNLGTEAVRLQVTGFAWGQGPDGEIQLTPSEELTFFPALLTLQGGEARKLRVGVKAAQGPLEKTYRVMIEELPSLTGARPGEVQVRTRMGIPIFLAPTSGGPTERVEGVRVQGRSVHFSLRNGGTSHFVARKLTVVGRSKTGDPIFEINQSGWYVLAGGTRNYAVEIPKDACKLLKSADIVVETEDATVVRSLANPVTCGGS
jgi:fimbrial chaperone protein